MNIYSKLNPPNGFYVYAYLRNTESSKTQTPYYIGKGRGGRAWVSHRSEKGGIHTPKDPTKIIILEQNLTELGAFALERRMIKWYGRKDLGAGILHNKTNGGDGVSGYIVTEELAKKRGKGVSKALKGKEKTIEHRMSMSKGKMGHTQSESTKIKRSLSLRGKILGPHSEERKANISKGRRGIPARNKGKPMPKHQLELLNQKVQCPYCTKIGPRGPMGRWHFSNCKNFSF
jgi:hypothetical protein